MTREAKIAELRGSLKKHEQERAQLMKELDSSLDIQALWPEAFEHGSVKTKVSDPHWDSFAKQKFIITRGDGTTKEFAAVDVPTKLLEPHISYLRPQRLDQVVAWFKHRGKRRS